MTATYTDYTSNGDNGGWSQNLFGQPYSNQQYYNDNGQNPYTNNISSDQLSPYISNYDNIDYQFLQRREFYDPAAQRPILNPPLPIAIRRHTPGSTIPPILQVPIPVVFFAPIAQPILQPSAEPTIELPVQETPLESIRILTPPIRNHQPVLPLPFDPSDRPIKPMKDTSVYNNPSSTVDKPNPPKKHLPPLKPIPSLARHESGTFQLPPKSVRSSPYNKSDRLQSASNPVQSSPHNTFTRFQSASNPLRSSPHNTFDRLHSASKPIQSSPTNKRDLFPLPPSRIRMNNVSARRPIRTDIKTLFDDEPPSQHYQHRQVVMQGYHNDDNNYPVQYIRSAPKKLISYRESPFITTEEMQNYQMPKVRRIVHVRPSPTQTVIYRT